VDDVLPALAILGGHFKSGHLWTPQELERDKEKLLDDIERRLTADIRREPLFTSPVAARLIC